MYIKKETEIAELSALSKDILRTMLYFSIFKYPLKSEELYFNSSLKEITLIELRKELTKLYEQGIIKEKENYFFIGNDHSIVDKRIAGNKKADKYLVIAQKMGKLISCFPYVRGVYISGSLSKGCLDDKGDIDFFVVTKPGRLWLSRTLIILFKKLFLFNSHKFLCPNYFIDTDHLEIEEKNIFTAKELNYLLPVYNQMLYEEMLGINEWRRDYMPNFLLRQGGIPYRKVWIKDTLEFILNSSPGEILDDFCLRITESFWRRKYKAKFGVGVNIRCAKHVSKFHPRGYQNKVIESYKAKIREFENVNNLNLA